MAFQETEKIQGQISKTQKKCIHSYEKIVKSKKFIKYNAYNAEKNVNTAKMWLIIKKIMQGKIVKSVVI